MNSKTCPKCNIEKLFDEFRNNISRSDGKHSYCKECSKTYDNDYYQKNINKLKEKKKKTSKIIFDNSKKFIYQYLITHPCVDCNEDDISCLEFDHVRSKKFRTISDMRRNGFSLDKIKKEIEKCDVRCANCHRKKHAKENDWFKII